MMRRRSTVRATVPCVYVELFLNNSSVDELKTPSPSAPLIIFLIAARAACIRLVHCFAQTQRRLAMMASAAPSSSAGAVPLNEQVSVHEKASSTTERTKQQKELCPLTLTTLHPALRS